MADNDLIKLEDVNLKFPSGEDVVTALKNVNISITEGSFTIIYGASGSGKSTLLNVLTGLQAPTSGKVLFKDQDLYAHDRDWLAGHRADTLGMVYQTNYWVQSLTVLENIAVPLYFLGYSKLKAEKQAMKSLEQVGIAQHAKKLPSLLSGGEQQRVSMARALVNNPSLIVADEPTGNLDNKAGDRIVKLLVKSQQDLGHTVVLVTHELEYLPLATKLFHIDDGAVAEVAGKDIKASTDSLLHQMVERINTLEKRQAR